MKKLALKERVDILLDVGTTRPEKWMPVREYVDPQQPTHSVLFIGSEWFKHWKELKEHHANETTFLFEVIEELRERLKEQK